MRLRSLPAVQPLALAALAALAACSSKAERPASQGVEVTVQPPSTTVPVRGGAQFAALVTGATDTSVVWSVVEVGGGTVDIAGRYTAPAGTGLFHVQAQSKADPSQKAVAAVTVQAPPPPPPPVVVTISPASGAVDACKTAAFTASVTGTTNGSVTWSVQEGATGGAVTAAGVYTAPAVPGTYHLVATSAAAPTSSASVAVTVSERILAVAVTPPTVTVLANGTAQFTATVTTSCGSFTAAQAVALGP